MRRSLVVVLLVAFGATTALARVEGRHKYFSADAGDDLRRGATDTSGLFPASIETPSGTVPAPDAYRSPWLSERSYGGRTAADERAGYSLDADTRRPTRLSYHDPFVPAVTPYKRSNAYDRVTDDFELVVADTSLRPVQVGGRVGDDEDQFFADLAVDLVAGEPVRLPSPGPGAQVRAASVAPEVDFQLLADGADNRFIRGEKTTRVRLILQLSVPRAAFGDALAEFPRGRLARALPTFPGHLAEPADRVLGELGLSQATPPREALEALVGWARSFSATDEALTERGVPLFERLARERLGVCRHRAWVFVVLAQRLGIPARFVHNEAHAWVEVFDGVLWARIDLGGAAAELEDESEESELLHQPPADPFAWPESAHSGAELVPAERRTAQPAGGAPDSAASTAASAAASADPGLDDAPDTPAPLDDEARPEAVGATVESSALRGRAIRVRGQVTHGESPCPATRVDVTLVDGDGHAVPLGAVATGRDGRFDGEVVLRGDVPVGDYRVSFSAPPGSCGGAEVQVR